jgi:indolepyruvate ferredoxin oxidoreductase beta subunit
MDVFKLVIAGVGGQGTLLASRILAEAGIKTGLPVKIGETYGMAQRGGPVMGHLQMGGDVKNPQIRKGEASVLLAFEPAEGVRRGITYLEKSGLALINSRKLPPIESLSGITRYPDVNQLMKILEKVTTNIFIFDATETAEKAGDPIATNVVMIGALAASGKLPYPEERILEVLNESLSLRYLELNLRAFQLGKKAYLARNRI